MFVYGFVKLFYKTSHRIWIHPYHMISATKPWMSMSTIDKVLHVKSNVGEINKRSVTDTMY
jgi:hypothetical protein